MRYLFDQTVPAFPRSFAPVITLVPPRVLRNEFDLRGLPAELVPEALSAAVRAYHGALLTQYPDCAELWPTPESLPLTELP